MFTAISLVNIHHLIWVQNKRKRKNGFFVIRTVRIYSLNSFYVAYSNCINHIVKCVPSTYLSCNWKFVRFDHLCPITLHWPFYFSISRNAKVDCRSCSLIHRKAGRLSEWCRFEHFVFCDFFLVRIKLMFNHLLQLDETNIWLLFV